MSSLISNPTTAAGLIGGAAVGGVKLVLVGMCLVIGFSIGNAIMSKINNSYTGWNYARQEKKNPEP